MELEELLHQAHCLPADRQRRVAAVLGSLVADAAAQPLHWVYDPVALQAAISNVDVPEFLPKSANPYYRLPTGSQSPYGDQLIVMLESLVASKGFNAADCAKRMFEAFGPGSPYADNSQLTAKYAKTMKDKSMYPVEGKWQGFNLRRFTKLYAEGKSLEDESEEDSNVDPENISRSVPLVALYAGSPEMFSMVHTASSQLQTSDLILTIVLASCRIMEQYILTECAEDNDGSKCPQVDKVIEDLKSPSRVYPNSLDRAIAVFLNEVLDNRKMSVDEATKKFGNS